MDRMSYVVTEEWLKNNIENTVVIDVRFNMNEPDAGRQSYVEGHIPSAVYLDLYQDLAGAAGKHGGKRPLPDVALFSKKLGEIGVTHEKPIVIYDQKNGIFAGRAWWLIHYLGHEKVYVLEGGFTGWVEAGNEITDEITENEAAVFEPDVRVDEIVDMERVKENINEKSAVLIDSRSRDRYLGKEETMHDKAGHIPGAKNFFWKNVLNDDGTYKNTDELEENFSSLSKDDEIIVSCGSGISATPNILALKTLGYKNVKLYPGSFSDWISYEENELETKEE